MENIDILGTGSFVAGIGFYIVIIYIIQIACSILIWGFVIKTIITAFKRTKVHNYFKNNVVINDNINFNNDKSRNVYNDVPKSSLAKLNIDDINVLKDFFYNKFIEFETAYNNLDLNVMKLLSTKQLFYNYQTGINLDLKAGKKRIINDIERNKVILYELDSTIAKQIASVMIEVSYINYTIDKKGNVISGSRNQKITERFEVEFRKDFETKIVTECPNCGASISGNKCEYCRSIIHNVDFKISSIKRIID